MLVRRLEIQGFKSFADRTVLEFGPGSTGIVGPNGAGKSNVTDAIRWALGEQNPRILRSSRMEDIIFNGSETRKPLGFAEVSLTLDNQDGKVPLEYAEVAVTRRLYRSGESEYLINGTPARLKDITDLLAGTGLGREGYSLIGQGRIDEILMSTPESRRSLFDEACGIGVHRGRKREALARLDDVHSRLERVADVTTELETQLAPLDRQAAVARAFVGYRDELERLELWLESQALGKLRARVAGAKERLDEAAHKVEGLKEAQARLGEQTRTLRAAQAELGSLVEQKQQEAAMSEAALRQLVSKIGDLERSVADRRREADLTRGEQGRLGERAGMVKARLAELATEKTGRDGKRAEVGARLGQAVSAEEAGKAEVARLRAAADSAKSELLEAAGQASAKRYQLNAAEADLARLAAERARATRDNEAAREELARLEAELAAATSRLAQLEPKVAGCAGQLAAEEQKEQALGSRLLELSRVAESRRAEVFELDSKRASLEAAMAVAGAWSRSALAAVAAARDRASSPGESEWAGGLVGVLGEVLEVPAPERQALEVALGRFAGALVVRTEDDLRRLVAHLRKEGLGPAVVVPIDLVEERLAAGGRPKRPAGRVMAEVVSCPDAFRPVVEHLLGDVLLAKDLDEAQRAVSGGAYRRAVTRDGFAVRPGGVVSVATPEAAGGTLPTGAGDPGWSFEVMRELRDVRDTLDDAKARLVEVAAEREGAEKALADARASRASLASEHRTISLEAASATAALGELGRRRSSASEKAEAMALAVPQLGQRALELEAGRKALQESLRESARGEEKLRSALAQQDAQLKAAESRTVDAGRLASEARMLAVAVDEQEKAGGAEARRLADEGSRLAAEETRLATRLSELAGQAETAQREVGPLREKLSAATAAASPKPGEDLETWRKRRRELSTNLETVEAELAEVAASLGEWDERQRREEARLARLEAEDEMTVRRLRRDWGEDWETRAGQTSPEGSEAADPEAVQARVAELRQAIGGLGVVNIGAIEEHRRLSERAGFLKGQAQDLTNARESLLQLVAEMDETMAAKFEEGFLAVRRAFRDKIPELFGGGRGDLTLTDRDHLLDSGIEILVEPPAKKLQSLALLSAGERALAALGLLLSFLEVRPSPFVILDEIDAPLDDANVARFCSAVARMAGRGSTQFIIVTHNKTTMEIPESLYGVTMGEDGVSRLLSVKLEDREAFGRRLEQEAGQSGR